VRAIHIFSLYIVECLFPIGVGGDRRDGINNSFHIMLRSNLPGRGKTVLFRWIFQNNLSRELTQLLPPYTYYKDPSHVEVNFEAISAGTW